jgi:hypothetical protein
MALMLFQTCASKCSMCQSYVIAYFEWTGQLVQLETYKSEIVGANLQTGKATATDSTTLHWKPFTVLRPDELHKHLGVGYGTYDDAGRLYC